MRAVIQCRTSGAALSYSFDPIPAQTSILHLISNNSSHTPTIIHLFKHLVSQSCIPDKHGFTCGVIRSYNLKKRISLLPEGVLIQPNGSYIPKFVELLKLGNRRFKGLPHQPTLEKYQADQHLQGLLGEAEPLYFSLSAWRDSLHSSRPTRPDIGFTTKVLSTWMSMPCAEAMSAVCHLALYLAGTEKCGVLLQRCENYENRVDRWLEQGEFMEPFGEDRRKRSILNLDVFADSSWGACLPFKHEINKFINHFFERCLCFEFLTSPGYSSLELM